MADLSAALETAQQAYLDNSSYFADGDVAKAKAFVTACTQLEMLIPERTRQGARFETAFGVNLTNIAQSKSNAENYIRSKSASSVRYSNFRDFRD